MHLAPLFAVAYLLDLILGDPESWPHPVRWIGRMSVFLENKLYANSVGAGIRHWVVVMAVVCAALYLFKTVVSLTSMLGILATIWLIYAALATRSLHAACARVEAALSPNPDIDLARSSLACIVGRETAHLDEQEIRRGVLETMAENLSDGIVAPIFYLTLGGPALMILYKTVNTLDSMIGYTNKKYMLFGRFAARVDDAANFIPARLTGLLLVLSARLTGKDWKGAWKIMLRDHHKASSPNAGVPEAAFAGALGIRLGGTSTYFGTRIDKPFIGDPHHEITTQDHAGGVRLLYATSVQAALICIVCLTCTHAGWWGMAGGLLG
jgi:adenosylcobinamide-phosphate synthase